MNIAVVVPLTGDPLGRRAVESVLGQAFGDLELYAVVDGPERAAAAEAVLEPFRGDRRLHVVQLPVVTGADGFNGHRVYGAMSFLVNEDYVSYLDEDNFLEPDHHAALAELCNGHDLEWAFALRNVLDPRGGFVARDDCQSLGHWPMWLPGGERYLVDTNCYLVRRDVAITTAPIWHRPTVGVMERSPDYRLCRVLRRRFPRYGTSGRYTVNYVAGRSATSVQPDFFVRGNAVMAERHPHGLPWSRPQVFCDG